MLTGQALKIVLNLAKFGDAIAQVKGIAGKRLSDKERTNNIEAIEEIDFLLKSYEDPQNGYTEDDYMEDDLDLQPERRRED